MNSHKNARLTIEGRKLLIERIAVLGLIPAAEAAGISRQTARKWQRRFEEGGQEALRDRSSRPDRTRSTVDRALAQRIEQLRRARMPMRRIAAVVGRSVATVSRFLAGRFIQTRLREWAYGRTWSNSAERTDWLPAFLAYYNVRRPHSALGYKPPASRLGGNNLLQLNT